MLVSHIQLGGVQYMPGKSHTHKVARKSHADTLGIACKPLWHHHLSSKIGAHDTITSSKIT